MNVFDNELRITSCLACTELNRFGCTTGVLYDMHGLCVIVVVVKKLQLVLHNMRFRFEQKHYVAGDQRDSLQVV